ncbi:hypothetical protein PTTG_04895 [Puccinia triticina 1-1 BBBD Race 1]|uniref:ubiquitinyl hydrolase 1 n=1 Tax=Puccinia triticina (isolate 1-1 / race 1 (BBBD)) TaxID=630390 RepID=A0A180GSZ7_PUCT1|nr:hypothetical protein PTTG_04895 [Puccinia triticina 1-1 BBBD Race 1]
MTVSVDDPKAFAARHLIDLGIPVEDAKKYSWKISGFDDINKIPRGNSVSSGTFTVGGYQWSMFCYPRDRKEGNDMVSVFLKCRGPQKQIDSWHACAQFVFAISNPTDGTCYVVSSSSEFRYKDSKFGCGVEPFVKLRELRIANGSRVKPIIEDHEVIITAFVRVLKDESGLLWHDFVDYDSKKYTGYVPLKNLRLASHLDPILQSLFLTNSFRKAVYQIPTAHDGRDSVVLALQRVLYQLQTSDESVGTAELKKSLGWKASDASQPYDAQEFTRLLRHKLHGRMKGTPAEDAFRHLMAGKRKRYIKSVDNDHEISQEETFFDVELNIKDLQGGPFKTLQDSFKAYVAPRKIDSDKRYHAGIEHGLKDAEEGTIFMEFPHVLHLHLKRFEYNLQEDKQVKINDQLGFPFELDLAPYLDESADKTANWNYRLHSVLVHSEEDQEPEKHYALIKPRPESKWYKFDDQRVIPVTDREVLKSGTHSSRNAHMLVYVRETEEADILAPITLADTPIHLRSSLQKEQIKRYQKMREEEEMGLYLTTKIVTEKTFRAHQGFDMALFDAKNMPPSDLPTFRVAKQERFLDFKSRLAQNQGHQPEQIRLRPLFAPEERPRVAVPEDDHTLTMESVRQMAPSDQDLHLYLEVIDPAHEAQAAEVEEKQLMIFLKYFNVSDQTLSGIGHFWVKEGQKGTDLVPLIKSRMEFPEDRRLKIYEEIAPGQVNLIDLNTIFTETEMADGDIICFELEFSNEELENLGRKRLYLDPVSFYDFLANRVLVQFKPRHTAMAKTIEFDIPLSRTLSYSQMAHLAGEKLQHNPAKLRFTNSDQGEPQRVIRQEGTVANMIESPDNNSINNIVFYELLDLPVDENETERKVNITWTGAHNREEGRYSFFMPKTSSVQDVIDKLSQLSTWVKFPKNSSRKIKLFTFRDGQIEKQFSGEELLSDVFDLEDLYATEAKTTVAQYDPVGMLKMLEFVTKLNADGTNYQAWLRTVDSILGMATGKVNLLTSPDQTIGPAEDLIIKQAMAASVDNALVLTVLEAESGMMAFDKIKKRWNSRSKQITIMKEILQTRFKICDTTADIGSHFRAIRDLAGNLFRSGFELTKESFIGLFFHLSLPRLDIRPFVNISRRIDAQSGGAGTISNDQLVRLTRTELANFRRNHQITLCQPNTRPTGHSTPGGQNNSGELHKLKRCHKC